MTRIALAFALAFALLATGCARPSSTANRSSESSAYAPVETLPSPGLAMQGEDRASAVGTFAYVPKHGGYFALMEVEAGEKVSTDSRIVCVITAPDGSTGGRDLAALIGAYMEFSGPLLKKSPVASTQLAIAADSYRILAPSPK